MMTENTLLPYVAAMPENTVRVKLPHSEVAMHMKLAGRDYWVAASGRAAQIYSDDGQPFSFPVLLAEAGLDEHGRPQTLLAPTCTAFSVCYRDAANYKNTNRVILADAWDEHSFRASIAPKLEDGVFFTPCQVGLPDAHITPTGAHDHPSHTFCSLGADPLLSDVFTLVREQPTVRMTWRGLCERFEAVSPSGFDTAHWPGTR
jgi:hypothetical protein